MPQPMAGGAEGDQVFGLVGAAEMTRLAVMDLQESGVGAAWCLATMAVAGEDLATGSRGDGGGVAVAGFGDG